MTTYSLDLWQKPGKRMLNVNINSTDPLTDPPVKELKEIKEPRNHLLGLLHVDQMAVGRADHLFRAQQIHALRALRQRKREEDGPPEGEPGREEARVQRLPRGGDEEVPEACAGEAIKVQRQSERSERRGQHCPFPSNDVRSVLYGRIYHTTTTEATVQKINSPTGSSQLRN